MFYQKYQYYGVLATSYTSPYICRIFGQETIFPFNILLNCLTLLTQQHICFIFYITLYYILLYQFIYRPMGSGPRIGSSGQDTFQAGTFGVSLRASGAHLVVDTYVSKAGPQLTSLGPKTSRHSHGAPTDLLWSKNVTSLMRGPNLPFNFLDCQSTVLIWVYDLMGF